jgi:hypothetical protein
MNRETRTLFAVALLGVALFLTMNYIIIPERDAAWWLVVLAAVLGVVLAISARIDLARGRPIEEVEAEAAAAALPQPRVQVYEFSASGAPALPMAAPALASPVSNGTPDDPLPHDDAPQGHVTEPTPPPLDADDSPAAAHDDPAGDDPGKVG